MHSQGVQLREDETETTQVTYFNSCTHRECNGVYLLLGKDKADISIHALTGSTTLKTCLKKQKLSIFQFMHSQGVQPQHIS